MSTAAFLGPFKDIAPTAAAPAAQAAIRLKFIMQTQMQSHWCWAAVAASVCQFLGDTGDNTVQCKIADIFLSAECCLNPMPDYNSEWAGNQPYALLTALHQLNHSGDEPSPALDFESITEQIDNSKPVCCHISYASDPDGHFVVITGYDRNGNMIIVQDPELTSPHNGMFSIAQFNAALGGSWDQTVLTD